MTRSLGIEAPRLWSAGMLERARDMGGSFDVQSSSSGTTLTIVIPLRESDLKVAEEDSKQGMSAA